MFSNKIIPVMMCALLLCLMVVNCNKKVPNENNQNNESIQCVKDGVITIEIITVSYKTDGLPLPEKIDSLLITENENNVLIDNPVYYEQSQTDGSTVSFFGNFQGMSDSVFVWRKIERHSRGSIRNVYDTFILRANHGISVYPQIGSSSVDKRSDVFIFCLDDDSLHSGEGTVVFEMNAFNLDSLKIDSQKNTAIIGGNVSSVEFVCPLNSTEIYFTSNDRESFTELQDGGICLVEYIWRGKQKVKSFPSFSDYSISPDPDSKIRLLGFAPMFKRNGVKNE